MRNNLLALTLFTASAQAQLTAVDNGAAAVDSNGLMWANTVGINLNYDPANTIGYSATAQTWIAGLNAQNYDGHNDWTLASGDGGAVNTTTNQLGELFYADCGNIAGTQTTLARGCGAFSSLTQAINTGTNGFSGDVNISSSTSLGLAPGQGYYAWMIYRADSSLQDGWDGDTSNAGITGVGDALAVRASAPEIDLDSTGSWMALLMGSLAVLRGRRLA